MTEQLDIFGGAVALQRPMLTERQQAALDEIRKAEGGLSSDEVGAVLHERRGSHDRGTRCAFCTTEGRQVAARLKALGYLVQKRGGMWQAITPLDSGDASGAASPVSSGSSQPTPIGGAAPPSTLGQGPNGRAAARLTDPATSHQAAATVGDLTGKQQAVLDCFHAHGPMTDEQLLDAYRHDSRPDQTDSGLRTRRHELVDRGSLRHSGRQALTRAGRPSIVWEIADGIPW